MNTQLPQILQPYANRMVREIAGDNSVPDFVIFELGKALLPGGLYTYENWNQALADLRRDPRKLAVFWLDPTARSV